MKIFSLLRRTVVIKWLRTIELDDIRFKIFVSNILNIFFSMRKKQYFHSFELINQYLKWVWSILSAIRFRFALSISTWDYRTSGYRCHPSTHRRSHWVSAPLMQSRLWSPGSVEMGSTGDCLSSKGGERRKRHLFCSLKK